MRLLLDAGDDGMINHPANGRFIDLIEELHPIVEEFLWRHNGRREQNATTTAD